MIRQGCSPRWMAIQIDKLEARLYNKYRGTGKPRVIRDQRRRRAVRLLLSWWVKCSPS